MSLRDRRAKNSNLIERKKMFDKNSGYTGFSMSNRAAEAYTNGEKPYSKWTKREILEKVREISADKEQLLSRLPMNYSVIELPSIKCARLMPCRSWVRP